MIYLPEAPQAHEFEDPLPEVGINIALSLEHLAFTLVKELHDNQYAPLIAAPDNPNLTATQQVESDFSYESDPDIWRTNIVLLVGMAAHKKLQLNQQLPEKKPQLILGQTPREILTDYFKNIASRPDAEKLHLPQPAVWKGVWEELRQRPWFDPAHSDRVSLRLKEIAEREFINHVYRMGDGPDILNPKVAYLWSADSHWKSRRLADTKFKDWLEGFHKDSRYLVVGRILQNIQEDNREAAKALELALAA
jgi:hypothetical protein